MRLRDCQQTGRLDTTLLGGWENHIKQGTGEQNGERAKVMHWMTGGHVTVNTELHMNSSPIKLHHRTHCPNLPFLNTVFCFFFSPISHCKGVGEDGKQMSNHLAVNGGQKCGLRSHHVTGQ